MRLFLAEKPDQAKIISAALGKAERASGYHQCGGDVVTWCFGHLLMPKMPEDYEADWKPWSWDTLPMFPQPFGFKPRKDAGKQINVIRQLLAKASEVVVATDADREGELIAYEVLTYLAWRGPTNRLWLSDLTPSAVRKAVSDIRPGAATKPLYYAAFARMCADWIVGLNMTRAATLKLRLPGVKSSYSVGRVQTPTLALVVRLERRIRDFRPETYYELVADIRAESGHVVRMRFSPPADKRIQDRERIERGRTQAEGKSAPIEVETADKSQPPPELLDLNRLQQEANTRFGYSADKTLQIAQSLYETHAVLTYPRTDSTALPEDHAERIPTILGNLGDIDDLAPILTTLGEPDIRQRHYDDKRVTAHHAIVPTLKACSPENLSEDERRVYMLVARHYLAAHMPDYEYKATAMRCKPGGVPFRVTGSVPIKEGWRAAFNGVPDGEDDPDGDADDHHGDLPPIRNGATGTAHDVKVQEKQTKPPNRYTESTLLKAMQNIAKEVDDPNARKRLKETSGIGTVATRARIIETLKERKFITVKQKKIQPTDGGMGLIAALEASLPAYADPTVTAQWEDQLEVIASGQGATKDFINRIAGQIKSDVEYLKQADGLPMFDAQGKPVDAETRRAAQARQAQRANEPAGNATDWKTRRREAVRNGIALDVPYDKRAKAKEMGALWDKERKVWMIHPDTDTTPFVTAGFLKRQEN